jgi:membrane protease subunit (stomatin/prohibitin family)
MLVINFHRQPISDDFNEVIRIIEMSDGTIMWDAIPDDLTLYLTIKEAFSDWATQPAAELSAASNDGTGMILVREGGMIEIYIPAATMQNFAPGSHLLHVKAVREGKTFTLVSGILPLICGA